MHMNLARTYCLVCIITQGIWYRTLLFTCLEIWFEMFRPSSFDQFTGACDRVIAIIMYLIIMYLIIWDLLSPSNFQNCVNSLLAGSSLRQSRSQDSSKFSRRQIHASFFCLIHNMTRLACNNLSNIWTMHRMGILLSPTCQNHNSPYKSRSTQ